MAKISAGAAVAAAAVNNSFMQPMRVRPAGYSTEVEPPSGYVFLEQCCAGWNASVLTWSPKCLSCVRCVLTQCVSLACALRVQRKRISTCCVNKHATGRAAVLQQPCQWLFASGNIFLYETRCDRQRSNSCDRTS